MKDNVTLTICEPVMREVIPLPIFASPASCGFPSPADDFVDYKMDLNEYLIQHPAATFFVRAEGRSMIEVGIFPKDILIVDRSLEAHNNSIVIACINGEFTVKKYVKDTKGIFLIPCNKEYNPIQIRENMEFVVWGVVTAVIHKLTNSN
jgi:DNA polymerase V